MATFQTPKPLNAHQIWRSLSPDQRRLAAHGYWRGDYRDERIDALAVAATARFCNLREKKVWSATIEQRSKWTALVQELPEIVSKDLLFYYLVTQDPPVLASFYDLLEVPHESGILSYGLDLSILEPAEISNAAKKLESSFDNSLTDTCFRILVVQDPEIWAELVRHIGNIAPTLEDFFEKKAVSREAVVAGEESFTMLDDLLTSAIIASTANVEGSLGRDQLDDLLSEVLELNTFRHKTLFHRGFVDVIFDRPLETHGPVENESRRRWYLCGAIVAYARKSDDRQIEHLYDTEEDVKAFGREVSPRSLKAAQFVFEALCRQGRSSAAASFLAPEIIVYGNLFDLVMKQGTHALRSSDFDSAYALFSLLDKSLKSFPEEAIEQMTDTIFDLRRRTAHCLRLKGQFGAAREILSKLLENPLASSRSAMLTDLAIMSAGYRGLMDVVIPEKDLTGFVKKLEGIQPHLERALEESGIQAHAQYCLGVLVVANQKNPSRAADLLEPSVGNMLRRSTAYDFGGLLSRSQFYLALALAETLNPSFVSRSLDLFTRAVDSEFVPPQHLLKRYLEALLLVSSEAARVSAEIAVRRLKTGRAALDSLIESELPVVSEPVLRTVMEWACNESRPGKQRYADLRKVLQHAIRANNVEVAENALDAMERLAMREICTDRFIELLSDVENYDPAWDASDAEWCAVALLEIQGRYHESTAILRSEFHKSASSSDHGSLLEATDILQRIRDYGLADENLGDLESRLTAIQQRNSETNDSDLDLVPVSITVVGGDEMQARYDESLRSLFRQGPATIDLQFRHTNWSSNHGEQFEQMKPLLDRSDAVVVLRRIRTNLGRNVRRYCPVWIGCAGESKGSIERAIHKAVFTARSRKTRGASKTNGR